MALTYRNLFDRLAQLEKTAFARYTAEQLAERVGALNEALRWAWKGDYPAIPLPYTMGSDTVTVTGGKIDPDDLGDGTFASVWSGNPQGPDNEEVEIDCTVGWDGLYPVTSETEVFAFFRKAVPQGVYEAEDDYGEPDDIPDALEDIVPLRALLGMKVASENWDAVNGLLKLYGDPRHQKEAITAAMLASGMPWQKHYVTLFPVVTP